jgi:hypothetical protein
MMRIATFTIVLLASAMGPRLAYSQFGGASGGSAQPGFAFDDESPMSVFNEDVRRFRFDLEGTLVTAETAEAFMQMYKGHDYPEIIGAYADGATDSLVVVGPPEAEHAIRVTLATWIVEQGGASPQPLSIQRRVLTHRRMDLLFEMADLEVRLVGSPSEKADEIRVRLQLLEDELSGVETQIEVIDRYIERLGDNYSDEGSFF